MKVDLGFALCALRNCGYEPYLAKDGEVIRVKYFNDESFEIAKKYVAKHLPHLTVEKH